MVFLNWIVALLIMKFSYGQEFSLPEVIFEAYQPSGFRASIPAKPGIELFAFHGKVNAGLGELEPGDLSDDIRKPANGYFTYDNPSLKLKKGDVIHYWVFLQNNKLGFRKDGQQWTVDELRKRPEINKCIASETVVTGQTNVCGSSVVFEDTFDGELDENKWTLEQYIPTTPDYEFVIYKKDKDVTFLTNNKLCIKPKLITDEKTLKEAVDLTNGCTKQNPNNCVVEVPFLLQNPVVSGRITSKIEFTYGKFEIKTRLPRGDWIFPEIYLEDDHLPEPRKIWIAYARGNAQLMGNDGSDIGGSLLFGGPISNHTEPQKSEKLSSYKHSGHLGAGEHIYTLTWKPNQLELYLDNVKYGTIDTESGFTGENPSKFRLVLGVGVGGINDFPDGFKSGQNEKPWTNKARNQVKQFYQKRNTWYPTWRDPDHQLQVDYIKVTAI